MMMMRWMISGLAASGASAAGGPRTAVINIKARLRQGGIVTALSVGGRYFRNRWTTTRGI